jgi:hypothetical protein
MALYPLVAPGFFPSRLHRRIVAYINQQMEEGGDEIRVFIYGDIAAKLDVEPRDVEDVLQELGGGGNGITVVKRDAPNAAAR